MQLFFDYICTSLYNMFFGIGSMQAIRSNILKILQFFNADFGVANTADFVDIICFSLIILFVYLLIRVLQQIIGIISKIIGGLF